MVRERARTARQPEGTSGPACERRLRALFQMMWVWSDQVRRADSSRKSWMKAKPQLYN